MSITFHHLCGGISQLLGALLADEFCHLKALKKKGFNRYSSWWFQPHLKNMIVKLDHLPQVGMKIKNI